MLEWILGRSFPKDEYVMEQQEGTGELPARLRSPELGRALGLRLDDLKQHLERIEGKRICS